MNNIVSDLGEIKIHHKLIAQIAETVALKVDGVSGLAMTTERWLAGILSSMRLTGVRVDLSDNIQIIIPILVTYGYNVPEVSAKVQEEVLLALRQMLNIETAKIIVKVKGLGLEAKADDSRPLFENIEDRR
jgi:uncharacterized alkaline shock family protein YloU